MGEDSFETRTGDALAFFVDAVPVDAFDVGGERIHLMAVGRWGITATVALSSALSKRSSEPLVSGRRR